MSPAAEGSDRSGTILSGPPSSGGTVRRALSAVAACVLVWFVAAAPDDLRAWSFTAFLLLPATLLVLLVTAFLPARGRDRFGVKPLPLDAPAAPAGGGTVPGDGASVWPMGDVRGRVFRAFEGDH